MKTSENYKASNILRLNAYIVTPIKITHVIMAKRDIINGAIVLITSLMLN